MHYSPEEERYRLGVFLVNTSGKSIQNIKMLVKTKFKNIEGGEFFVVEYTKENFTYLPNHGAVVNLISANTPIEDLDTLKENTAADITFEIKDLELNGEKVSNEN